MKLGEFWGFLPLASVRGNRRSSASFGAKATSCGKLWRMSVDGRLRKLVDEKEACAKQDRFSSTGDLISSFRWKK